MESAQLRITKVMLLAESETFNVLADKEQFDLTSNTTLLFEPEGISLAAGDQIVCSFSVQSLSTTKPLDVVVEVMRSDLSIVINNRRRVEHVWTSPNGTTGSLWEESAGVTRIVPMRRRSER